MRRLLAVAGTAGLIAVGLMASPASADPPSGGDSSTLDCGAGGSYDIVIAPGGGNYTPAFDMDSNKVFIPVAFGPSHFTLNSSELGLIEEHEDGEARAGKRVGVQGKIMTCTYVSTFTFEDDPELGDGDGRAEGIVYGFASH